MNEEIIDNTISAAPTDFEPIVENIPEENTDGVVSDSLVQKEAPDKKSEKTTALLYLMFAFIALIAIYVVQFFHYLEPLFSDVHQGDFTSIFFYCFNIAFWIPAIAALAICIKKFTGYNVFHKGTSEIPLKRSLIIYALVAVPIFVVSAILGFELKVVFELGTKLSAAQVATNGVMYVHGAVKLVLGMMIIELVQEAFEKLFKFKYCEWIPWGGIVLALTFGFLEVIVTSHTAFIPNTFMWLYIGFDLIYGIIYVIAKKNAFVAYFTSLILFIL